MRKTVRNYSLVLRLAWLIMALSMVVLCGPVKKLIELHKEKNVAAQSVLDKKLHTGYRDRRESVLSINDVGFHAPAPDSGFVLFLFATALAAFICAGSRWRGHEVSFSAAAIHPTPRFINYRQLRL